MKKFYILMTMALALSFSVQAINEEKTPDKSEYSIQQKSATLSDALVDGVDGRYNRIYGSPYDGTCNAPSNLSGVGSNVLYKVYEIHTTVAEAADISLDETGALDDTYMTLYCSFDPLNADQGVFCGDDDGGAGYMSAFTPGDGYVLDANTSYYLVVAAYGNSDEGSFDINMGGNLAFGAPAAPPSVPLSNWAFALIGLFAVTLVFFKFRR